MPLTEKQKRLLAGATLFLTCFLVYIPALGAGFAWNDDTFFWNNPHIHSPSGLFTFWFTTEAPDYFPLTSSILWLEWRIFGPEQIWGYHAVNVLLHAVSSLLLWRLLERFRIPCAWGAALVFAIHPVNVETVAWITQLKTTLPMALSLACSLLFFQSGEFESDAKSRPPFRAPQYALSLFCFVLALLAKTSVAPLPAAFLVLIWWRSGAVTRRDFARVLPFFAVAGTLALVTIWFQYNKAIGDEIVRDDGFLSRLAISGWAIWFYLYKALLPFDLSFVYPRWTADPGNLLVYLPLAALLALFAVLWRLRARPWARGTFAALAIYGLMLFPVLGFFNIYFMRYSLVADHWQYHALPAVIALVTAAAGPPLADLDRWREPPFLRGIAVPLLLLLAVLTFRQAGEYRDEETLHRATIDRNPGAWMAHHNLGLRLAENGNLAEALGHLKKTIALEPNHSRAHSNLASALRENNQPAEAMAHYRKALEIDPAFAEAAFNLGNLLLGSGQVEGAIAAYRNALEINPTLGLAHNNLGIALLETGNRTQARARFETALEINPAHLTALNNLAWLLATAPEPELRDGAQAVALAREANRLTGGADPAVLEILAAALAEAGSFSEAIRAAQQAAHIATTRGDAPLSQRLRRQLASYTGGKPFRDTPSP